MIEMHGGMATRQLKTRAHFKKGAPLARFRPDFWALPNGTWTETGGVPDSCRPPSSVSRSDHTRVCQSTRGEPTIPARGVPAWDPPGLPLDPARGPVAARPECKSRSAPFRIPHGSRRETDRAPDGRRTLGFMTPAGFYTENMPNRPRFI
ncbi:hypothetical protein Bbelb_254210 [Branchiostoma belcheri]|nr:hypothetical protein Bbelb_254210 [Branchiostoma belcheri]